MLGLSRNPIRLDVDREVYRLNPVWGEGDRPEQIAKQIVDCDWECMSVVVLCEPLARSFSEEGADYYFEVGLGLAEQVALLNSEKHLPSEEEVNQIIRRRYSKVWRLGDDRTRAKLRRRIVRAHYLRFLPRVVLNFRRDGVEKAEELLDLFLPQVKSHVVRKVNLPYPLNDINADAPWSQFFLIDKGDRVEYAVSNYLVPDVHFRWGEVFMRLVWDVPTHVLRYTSMNELEFVRSYERFKLVELDGVSGEYRNRLMRVGVEGVVDV